MHFSARARRLFIGLDLDLLASPAMAILVLFKEVFIPLPSRRIPTLFQFYIFTFFLLLSYVILGIFTYCLLVSSGIFTISSQSTELQNFYPKSTSHLIGAGDPAYSYTYLAYYIPLTISIHPSVSLFSLLHCDSDLF